MSLESVARGFQNRLYIRATQETSYAVSPAADATHYFNLTSAVQLRINPDFISDVDEANGYEFETKRIPTEIKLPPKVLPMRASPEAIGLFLSYALGGDVPVSLAGTAYSHTMELNTIGTFPGSFTAQTNMRSATADTESDQKQLGCYLRRFSLIGARTGVVMLEVEIGGAGKTALPEDATESGLLTRSVYFLNNKARFFIKACASPDTTDWSAFAGATAAGTFSTQIASQVNLGEECESWRFDFNMNWSEESMYAGGMSSGSGVTGVEPHHGQTRTASWNIVAKNDSVVKGYINEVINTTASNNQQYAVGVEMVSDALAYTGYPYQAVIITPVAVFDSTMEPSTDLGPQTESWTFKTQKGVGSPSIAEVIAYTQDAYASAYNQDLTP